MDKNKSQHWNFTHETVPIMWHKQNDNFLKYLDKDGVKFLRFWWKHLVDNMGVLVPSSSEGLGFQVKETPDKDGKTIKLVTITLPEPVMDGEVFYMFLAKKPQKKTIADFFLLRLPTSFVIALQRDGINEDGKVKTTMYEVTPMGRNIKIGVGVEPVLETFQKAAREYLKL